MSILFSNPMLFLAQTRIEAVNQGFRERETVDSSHGYVVLAIIAALILTSAAAYCIIRFRPKQAANDSRKLFLELCRGHHLSWRSRWLLGELAKVKQIKDPTLLFFDAELWRFDPASEAKACSPKVRSRMHVLQRLLFAHRKHEV